MADEEPEREAPRRTPALEWIAFGIGLLITCAVLGVIGSEIARGGGERPPAIEVSVERVTATATGYVVEVMATNRSQTTAAAVQIEGRLTSGEDVATSSATIDYIPGESGRGAGLFFEEDPRAHPFELRALGYAEP